MRLGAALLIVSMFAGPAAAQAPYLVRDLGDAGTTAQSSDPASFAWSGGKLFFTAQTESSGREPWVRDASGTRLLRDIYAGPPDSWAKSFTELSAGVVLFCADDGQNGPQLWRSDGTEQGTTLLKKVNAGSQSFNLRPTEDGRVYFFVDDGVHGLEPWVTDGTADGTKLLADTVPGHGGRSGWVFRFGGKTLLLYSDGIWSTDWTEAGTRLVVPLNGYNTFGPYISGSVFYFVHGESEHGVELWKSDGTREGTGIVKDIRPGPASSLTGSVAATPRGAVFFAESGSNEGIRLWTTDGSEAGTVPLTMAPQEFTEYYKPSLYASWKEVFFWTAGRIWRTDGTEAGTSVAATAPGGTPFGFVNAFTRVYFSQWIDNQLYLMQFDPALRGEAVKVRSDVTVANVTFTGGRLWFSGRDPANGNELWTSDGTAAGTQLVANIAPDPARSSSPENFTAVGPYLYFHPASPKRLWRSDGTAGGTLPFTDVDTNLISPPPYDSVTAYGGDIFYHHGHSGLYRADGATGVTRQIGNFQFDTMRADERFIYMWSWSGGVRRSDGTAEGTVPLYDANEPRDLRGYEYSMDVLPSGGAAWIRCSHGLYRTEGSVETTRRVAAVADGGYLWAFLVEAGGLMYSVVQTPSSGEELWRSDGTGGGSFLLKDIYPGAGGSYPRQPTAAGRLLFFTATTPQHGMELWRSDGTTEGTFLVKDIFPGSRSSEPSSLAALGEVLYFTSNDGVAGTELWRSDGTEAGTYRVRDVAPGAFPSKPSNLAAAAGRIWFSANDGLHGYELWSSDGTEAGTRLVGDIHPGSASSSPERLTATDRHLFFTARTEEEGRELWAVPLDGARLEVRGGRVTEGNDGRRPLRFTITRRGDSGGTASVSYATIAGTAAEGADYERASGTIMFSAGETVKTVDVNVLGDTKSEGNESFWMQLSSAVGVTLQESLAVAVIDDDDEVADLAIEVVPQSGDAETSRVVKVTNLGPSNARRITVAFIESPYEFQAGTTDVDVVCTKPMPITCTVPFLQAGTSRTLTIYRNGVSGLVDPAVPPGRTINVTVASAVPDPHAPNDRVAVMTTGNGALTLPSHLVLGVPATVTFDLGARATSARDVTLTASVESIGVAPQTARIEPGSRTATFTVTPSAAGARPVLTAAIGSQVIAALVVPVIDAGTAPKRDIAIVWNSKSSFAWNEPVEIAVRVAARVADGTIPSGVVSLLDAQGSTVDQLTLDASAAVTFRLGRRLPAELRFRVRYEGDANFEGATVPLPVINVVKATPVVTVQGPWVSCADTAYLRVVVNGPAGAPVPTGTVALGDLNAVQPASSGPLALTATGAPGESQASGTLPFGRSAAYVVADYRGDDFYRPSSGGTTVSAGCGGISLTATATSGTRVSLVWTPAPLLEPRYVVYRASSYGAFEAVAWTANTSHVDTTVQPGRVYVYVVRGWHGSWTPYGFSNPDLASTFQHSDDPLRPGDLMKSAHLEQLRGMIATLRSLGSMPALVPSGSVAPGQIVRASHLEELYASMQQARSRLGLLPLALESPRTGSVIRASDVQALRDAVK